VRAVTDPVEFIQRKLAMVDAVVKEVSEKVARERQYATADDEPLYEFDDDAAHFLAGNPLTVILMAEATRKLLELHASEQDCPSGPETYRTYVVGGEPCETVKLLAFAWGWTEETT
jgi:hypothetical protein